MTYEESCGYFHVKPDPITADACRFLERFGKRFCIDFGTNNAVEKAGSVVIETNPVHPIPRGREFLAADVSGTQWDRYDREWLRAMERAFANDDLARAS